MTRAPGVYLLHFAAPLAHAQHYLGTSPHMQRRINAHRKGTGGRLPAAFLEQGITFEVARVWKCVTVKEAYLLERALKRRKNGRRLCPVCPTNEGLAIP